MKLGEYNELEILRFTSIGAYLGDEEGNDVLLPGKFLKEDWTEGDKIPVFLYRDSEDRIIATTMQPYLTLGQFAYLKIRDVNFFGAFALWGVEKDLMIPFQEQLKKLEPEQRILVYLKLDEKTDRLIGTTKFRKYIEPAPLDLPLNEPIPILIADRTDLGIKVIVDHKYSGIIYASEITRNLLRGANEIGYVYKVREDGKLDVRLNPEGYQKIEPLAQELLEIIETNGGKINLNDYSDPEDIRMMIGMSKKSFKKAVGLLYKAKKIVIEEDGIRLI
ncbi:MAG: GntR family transcriptional regulator [Bacteroidetes bacterium]|nr:GntR family transcriptional regulator [Bacteroidota bacterium]